MLHLPRLLLFAVVILALAGCADQPADDRAAGTSPSDGPVPVEPDGGIGGDAEVPDEAPDFGVSSESDSAAVPPYTSCWSADGSGLCQDGTPDPDAVTLAAQRQLVVTYAEGSLTATWSTPDADPDDRQDLPVTEENPGIWLVDVSGIPAGDHTVWLSWQGQPGDAFTALTVTTG